MIGTVGDMIRRATEELRKVDVPDPGRDARRLVAFATGLEMSRLTLMANDPAPDDQWLTLSEAMDMRLRRIPLSHILGYRAFWTHDFIVTPDVLDPRPETEALVREALQYDFSTVLDLGVGSGAILLSLLAERYDTTGVGVDVSEAALDVARDNAIALGVSDRVTFWHSNWFEAVIGRYDMIVANPPYVARYEMKDLAPELGHEPRLALTDEQDGLSPYREITAHAAAHLRPGGRLIVEIGHSQGKAVADLFERTGFTGIHVLPDLDGRDRVVSARI